MAESAVLSAFRSRKDLEKYGANALSLYALELLQRRRQQISCRISPDPALSGFQPWDSEVAVSAVLSENIRDDRATTDLLTVTVRGRALACRPDEGGTLASADGASQVRVTCSLFDLDQDVDIALVEDLGARYGRRVVSPFGSGATRMVVNPVGGDRVVPRDESVPELVPVRVEGGADETP